MRRAAPAGNSWSGGWALAFAQRHPERVSRLALLDATAPDDLLVHRQRATVEAAGPLSQRRLGELIGVNPTIIVKLADTLEADGLLKRERDPADRRNYLLSITPAGKTALAEMARGAGRGEAELTAASAARRSSTRRTNDSPDRSARPSWAS